MVHSDPAMPELEFVESGGALQVYYLQAPLPFHGFILTVPLAIDVQHLFRSTPT